MEILYCPCVPARPGTTHDHVAGFDGYTVSREDNAVRVEQGPGDFPSEAELLATVRTA